MMVIQQIFFSLTFQINVSETIVYLVMIEKDFSILLPANFLPKS